MHRIRTIAGLVVVLSLAAPAAAEAVLTTTRDSVSAAGVQANAASFLSAISGNGRFVAFESSATSLVENDTNNSTDIFLRDRFTGALTRVSVSNSGAQASGQSTSPSVSADGRFVVFESFAANLVSGDTNGVKDIFMRDTFGNTTVRLSVSTVGAQANGESSRPRINAGGSLIAFTSSATNLVGGDTNQRSDVFVRDRSAGSTTRVSVSGSSAQANGNSSEAAISADGRFVAFSSVATNLVSNDTATRDIFIRDRTAGTTISATQGANSGSNVPALSSDGRFVVFESNAGNLVSGDTNGRQDVFRFDRTNSTRERVSFAPGAQADGQSEFPAISGDGRFVAFRSFATNLTPGDSNNASDVFVHDAETDTTTLASVDPAGGLANGASLFPSLSADGRFVAFQSFADNLVEGDTNAVADVFTFDRLPPTPATITYDADTGLSIVDGGRDVADFAVSLAGGVFAVNPFGSTALPLTIGEGCAAAAAGDGATCEAPSVTLVRAELGDAPDFFNLGGCPAALGDATVLGGDGDDTLRGGPGFDLLRGDAGLDRLSGCEGNDRLEGSDGNDILNGEGGADTFVGGPGSDRADYSAVTGSLNVTLDEIANDGTGGEADNVTADVENVTGGSAADNLTGNGVSNQFSGGGGNDVLVGGSEPEPSGPFAIQPCNRSIGGSTGVILSVCGDTLNGDRGNDNLSGQGQDDHLIGGLDVDTFNGGVGDDIINSRDGVLDTRIDCGPGGDTALIDLRDESGLIVDSNCETVAASDRREGPNVRIFADRPLRLRRGRLTVKLSCPRALRHSCRGRLRAATSRRRLRRAPANRYVIRRGRSRTLHIRVGRGVRRGGRVFLQAVERGDVTGNKTTRTIARVARR